MANQGEGGRFLPGKSGNPSGANLHRDAKGWQPFAKRVKTHFADMTEEQILELATNTKKLSLNDALIVKQLADALMPGDSRFTSAEKVFDRADGKVTENINGVFEVTNKADLGDAPLDDKQRDALRTLLQSSEQSGEPEPS